MTPTWTLQQAVELIQELEPAVRELNYHITLGGSVLHKGSSDKDLDLFIVPLNGFPSTPIKILVLLMDYLGSCRALRDGPNYQADADFHYDQAQLFDYMGKRIDVFIQ